MPYQP